MSHGDAFDLRGRLTDLDQVLGMVARLTEPEAVVDRDQLSVTLGILLDDAFCGKPVEQRACLDTVSRLLIPESDLNVVSRDDLATLLSVLAREYRAAHEALYELCQAHGVFPRPAVVMAAGAGSRPAGE